MVDLDKLYQDEAYALKVLIKLINKYLQSDEERIKGINIVSALPGCIPGRAVGNIFHQKDLSVEDQKVIQEIIDIYA
jgi:hypothetical protein